MASNNAAIVQIYRVARQLIWATWSFDGTSRNWHPDRWRTDSDYSNCLPVVELEHVPSKSQRCEMLLQEVEAIRVSLEALTTLLSKPELSRALLMATQHPATIAGHCEACFAFSAWSLATDRYESVLAFEEGRAYFPSPFKSQPREDYPEISPQAIVADTLELYLHQAGYPHEWDVLVASVELLKEAERATGEPIASFSETLQQSAVGKRRGVWAPVHALISLERNWRTWTAATRNEKAQEWNRLYGDNAGWLRLDAEKLRELINGRLKQEKKDRELRD